MNTRICTWEYVTNFDANPSSEDVVKQFKKDFSQKELNRILLNPLVSFNSSEGRKIRYLVMLVSESSSRKRLLTRRILPPQIWLYGWADFFLRKNVESLSCNGNALFWKVVEETLYILVFFEGRLCHWSEEIGYGKNGEPERKSLIRNRLDRFRVFLKMDLLFSRTDSFPEIEIQDDFNELCYKKAKKDSFWKCVDLRKVEHGVALVQCTADFGIFLKVSMFIVASVCSLWMCFMNKSAESFDFEILDVPPIELSEPSVVESVIEQKTSDRWKPPSLKSSKELPLEKTSCILPEIRIQGIVASRVFLAELNGFHELKSFAGGDSLGDFVVREIRRADVYFSCGDSVVVIPAG